MSNVGSIITRTAPLLVFAAALVLTAAKAKQCVPTPVELLCEKDSDCGGTPPLDCPGAWACMDAGCEWICEPPKQLCTSSYECKAGEYCTTEDGACESACDPSGSGGCAGVCMGECAPKQEETFCSWDGDCPDGQVCDYGFGGFAAPADPCPDPGCGAPPPQGVCVTPAIEECDGIDNDNDGYVDEGCAPGECATDSDCPAGYECLMDAGGCPALVPPGADPMPCKPATTMCVPVATECVMDQDCPAGTVCSINSGGACPPCVPGEACDPCDVATGWCEPWGEQCDGLDNDGDGLVDEGVCPADDCQADSDCLPGQICTQIEMCWTACDPNGDCWGDCGPQTVCMAP